MYDYVVIGAGSAGCAVTGRLSETGAEVLVLEAGVADDAQEIHIPAAFPMLFKSALDWDYRTVPQKHLNGRSDFWPRGKMLGGSSSMNAMIYQRGAPGDYDGWARSGNEGWSWADLLPVFIRCENQERGASEYHGIGGPMNVADPRDPNPLTLAMVDAARQCGYPITDDFNGPSQLGFGIYQLNQKNGMRWSAARGYLHPALARDNVTAITGALVTRLLFEDRRCTGVVYVADGIEHTVHARKEIILSGGTINSPQLLMLSGIGPRGHLADLGIELVLDLPGVGQNLADHMMVPVAFACTEPVSLAGATTDAQAARFQAEQMGLLTSNVGEAGGFLQLDSGSGAPELQFHFAPGYFIFHGAGNPEGDGFTMAATLVGTRSKGRMWLLSADPGDKPALDPNYLADSRDMDVLVEGTHIARTILGAPAFERYRGAEVLPGSGVDGRQDLEGHIRDYATGIYHPVGTCRMGDDDLAVVDNRLRVHGIDGLRIADASIMPQIINANTNNLCIAIGEKCAEFAMGRIEVPAPDPAAVRHTVT